MGKHSLSSIAKSVRTAMKKHSPEILTGIGIAGMITTTVMAVRATPKALILIEDRPAKQKGNRKDSMALLYSGRNRWFGFCFLSYWRQLNKSASKRSACNRLHAF